MNTALIKKELREALWKLVLGLALMIVTAASIPLMYEMIADLLSQLKLEEMGFFSNFMSPGILSDYSAYLWSQWNGKNLLNIGTVLAVILGMGTIAGEVSNQTISFLLTRPISRRTVFISKVFSGAFILAVIVAVSTVVMLVLAAVSSPEFLDVGRLLVATCITFLGLLLIYIMTVFFSTILSDPVKVAGVTILAIIVMYTLGWFAVTRKFALFVQMAAGGYFLGGVFPTGAVIVMLLTVVLLSAVGITVFERREY
ncbi:MAG: ABC transporter permease subunit [Bacillota bacterium]|nr:ABC transporter permease subunit [Bacillota bacterium]MDW7685326.1 ABC transporter permease subunit [Bacillota bacterium]